MTLDDALSELPLVAIIRGVTPDEAVAVAEALHAAGVRVVEVPLNSPDPFESIRRLKALEGRIVYGAGTVLSPPDVDRVIAAGGSVVVSPNTNPAVIRRTVELGLGSMPGFATPSEAFAAYEAGARILKLFPAGSYGPGYLKALMAVAPKDARIFPVGGVGAEAMADWWAAGARGFGIGGELYTPGLDPDAVRTRAEPVVAALRKLSSPR